MTHQANNESEYTYGVGACVQKTKGYKFPGVIVAKYHNLAGEVRYVVECTAEGAQGCQHIFNGSQLEPLGA